MANFPEDRLPACRQRSEVSLEDELPVTRKEQKTMNVKQSFKNKDLSGSMFRSVTNLHRAPGFH
jgi:hypothetical protein